MDLLRNLLHQLYSPEGIQRLIQMGGYVLLFAIIFSETGLLLGFLLPGDSLLFIAGTMAAAGKLNIGLLLILLCIAAISGDAVGYFLGRKTGPKLFAREDSRFFKRAHLEKTQSFYDRHGPKTIIMARFVPIVRTFAPTVAGAVNMKYQTFASYNIVGGIGWIFSMLLSGYFLGKQFPWIGKNIDKVIIVIVILSLLPIFFHWLQERKTKSNESTLLGAATEE